MDKPTPPPYSSIAHESITQPEQPEANALLDHLIRHASEHYVAGANYPAGAQAILDREAERVRNMLEFALSVDYERDFGASISAADHEHFTRMANMFRLLRPRETDAVRNAIIDATKEKDLLLAYFIKYLHAPCKALSLPDDYVCSTIIFLSRYTDRHGKYISSFLSQLRDYGVEAVASKLYMDREVIIPRVFADVASQSRMLNAVKGYEDAHFDRIVGVESSTQIKPGQKKPFQVTHSIRYEAKESLVEAMSHYKTTIGRACKDLSSNHWAKVIGGCMTEIAAKLKVERGKKPMGDPVREGRQWT
jgi:hypothetical protein